MDLEFRLRGPLLIKISLPKDHSWKLLYRFDEPETRSAEPQTNSTTLKSNDFPKHVIIADRREAETSNFTQIDNYYSETDRLDRTASGWVLRTDRCEVNVLSLSMRWRGRNCARPFKADLWVEKQGQMILVWPILVVRIFLCLTPAALIGVCIPA